MTATLLLNMTNSGREAMLDYVGNGLDLTLVSVKLGSGNYLASDEQTALQQPWLDIPVINGYVDKEFNNLCFIASGITEEIQTVSEIGLFDKDGVLFAVASKEQGYFFKTDQNVFFNLNLAISFEQKNTKKIRLLFNRQEILLQALLQLHLANKNPHPQYALLIEDLFKKHIAEVNPHNQYALKAHFEAEVAKMHDVLDRLTAMFLTKLE